MALPVVDVEMAVDVFDLGARSAGHEERIGPPKTQVVAASLYHRGPGAPVQSQAFGRAGAVLGFQRGEELFFLVHGESEAYQKRGQVSTFNKVL